MKKHFDKIILISVAAVLVFTLIFTYAPNLLPIDSRNSAMDKEYETKLFGSDFMTVDIVMDDAQWQDLLDNALDEEYYPCDVVINGTKFVNAGIRAKGNTSLSQVTTDRYSFKIEFDHYDSSQSCWGLDKLVLNNNMGDATMMKEYFVYDMFEYLDTSASLCNYADISINGERWGTYLALEAVDESFIERNYGTDYGMLYKPDSMNMGDNNFNEQNAENMGKRNKAMGGGFGGMSGSGADLNYTGDDTENYTTIWESSKLSDPDDTDKTRVITALKNISEGNDLNQYLDVDAMLRYLAVHTFSVNLDSLSGNMTHNYYLRESDGKLSLIPWDYNYAFGGFQSENASSMVNFPIDTPVSGVSMEDRPIFSKLLENEEYLEKYHQYYEKLVNGYFGSGQFEATYTKLRQSLDSRIESDPMSFFTYEEYLTAADLFYDVILLRAESVAGQLNGTVPSTAEGQNADKASLVDTTGIDLNDLGGGFGKGGGRGDFGMENMPNMDKNFTIPEDFGPSNIPNTKNMPQGGLPGRDMQFPQGGMQNMAPPDGMQGGEMEFSPSNMEFPEQSETTRRPTAMQTEAVSTQNNTNNIVELIIYSALMLIALIAAIFYRNRRSMR